MKQTVQLGKVTKGGEKAEDLLSSKNMLLCAEPGGVLDSWEPAGKDVENPLRPWDWSPETPEPLFAPHKCGTCTFFQSTLPSQATQSTAVPQ